MGESDKIEPEAEKDETDAVVHIEDNAKADAVGSALPDEEDKAVPAPDDSADVAAETVSQEKPPESEEAAENEVASAPEKVSEGDGDAGSPQKPEESAEVAPAASADDQAGRFSLAVPTAPVGRTVVIQEKPSSSEYP